MNLREISLKLKSFNPPTIPYNEHNVNETLSQAILSYLPPHPTNPLVLVCIGTDRSTGDSLGPLIGTKLAEKNISAFHVFGTLDNPVHALNLVETLQYIKYNFHHPFIVGIDACLGSVKNVGSISVGKGPVKPGAAVNKKLPHVGDIHITGTVNISGFMEFSVLQNTRLSLVMNMANTIANSIETVDRALR